jgi:hypothetical protein
MPLLVFFRQSIGIRLPGQSDQRATTIHVSRTQLTTELVVPLIETYFDTAVQGQPFWFYVKVLGKTQLNLIPFCKL